MGASIHGAPARAVRDRRRRCLTGRQEQQPGLTRDSHWQQQQHARRPPTGPATPCPNPAASHEERCGFPGEITTCRHCRGGAPAGTNDIAAPPSRTGTSDWQSPALNENGSRRAKISRPRKPNSKSPRASFREASASARPLPPAIVPKWARADAHSPTGARQCSWANVARGVWTANTGTLRLAAYYMNCMRTGAHLTQQLPARYWQGILLASETSARALQISREERR